MLSEVVKSYPWKCSRCLAEEARTRARGDAFHARELAITEVLRDGTWRTTIWRPHSGGPRTATARFTAALNALTDQPMTYIRPGTVKGSTDDRRRRPDPPRWIGRILAPGEEVTVPCGRRHGGYGRLDGTWQEGEPGSVIVSNERFVAQLQRIVFGLGADLRRESPYSLPNSRGRKMRVDVHHPHRRVPHRLGRDLEVSSRRDKVRGERMP
jgi:hypothetical protein